MVDVDGVRGLARQVGGLAEQTRATAVRVADAEGVQWQSTAARTWRAALREDARRVGQAAEQLDDAVRALHAHADAVEQRLAQIEAARRAFERALDDARRTLAGAADDATDAVTSAARRIVAAASRMPSPTSLDWPGFLGRG